MSLSDHIVIMDETIIRRLGILILVRQIVKKGKSSDESLARLITPSLVLSFLLSPASKNALERFASSCIRVARLDVVHTRLGNGRAPP
jgi:hypothetical protein